jgi:TonB family protein
MHPANECTSPAMRNAAMNGLSKIYRFVEEGKLLLPIQVFVLLAASLALVFSDVEFSRKDRTTVFRKDEKRYHVRKVSHIPKELEADEAEKIAVSDEHISIEDIRNRYFSYVVSRIERCKDYPIAEQKRGHEGSVLLEIFILKSGTVQKVRVLKKARYEALTGAAINTVRRALPFQAFPRRLSDDMMIIKLEIRFSLN